MNHHHTPAQPALDPSALRSALEVALAMIEDHLHQLPTAPVKPSLTPGDVARSFPLQAPAEPQTLTELFTSIRTHILPNVTHWQHPKFFAYYPAASSVPAILGEFLIASLASVGLQWSANPAATELECVVMDWILKLLHAEPSSPFLHSSRKGGGIIQNTAGEALAVIMVAARVQSHLQQGKHSSARQLSPEALEALYYQDSSKLVVYLSDHTHFSGPKAVRVAGMRVRKIKAQKLENGNYGITAAQVQAAMTADRAAGLRPCAVLLNYGSTNTSGADDLASFRGFAEREQLWVHVDAAYAGASLILPEFADRSHLLQEVSSSFNFNGSKWFLCGFDSAFLYVRDRQALKMVFAAGDTFMAQTQDEEIYNPEFKDWSIPLGRRFRALRIWLVLSYFGRSGLEAYLRKTIGLADWFRAKLDADPRFEQIAKTELGLVCFHLATSDHNLQDRFLAELDRLSGYGQKFLIYPSQCEGQRFLRLAIGSVHTELSDLEEVWQACDEAAKLSYH